MQNKIDSYQSHGGSLIEVKGELCWWQCTQEHSSETASWSLLGTVATSEVLHFCARMKPKGDRSRG